MKYPWEVSFALRKQISHLPPDLKFQVRRAMDDVWEKPEAGKPLEEDLAGYYSCRIGRYRLIYRIKDARLVLEAVGPREHIYERLVLEIGRQKIKERSAKYTAKPLKKNKTGRLSSRAIAHTTKRSVSERLK